MASPSPIKTRLVECEAQFTGFGDAAELPTDFGAPQLEYAAIRKAAGLMDGAHRGLVAVTGNDRIDYLQRMVSRDCAALPPGRADRMALLSEKGRIIADMVIMQSDDHVLIELDLNNVPVLISELERFIFTEDVTVVDRSSAYHRLSLHGPKAMAMLNAADVPVNEDFEPFSHRALNIAGAQARALRFDETGEAGVHLWLPIDHAVAAWDHLIVKGTALGMKPLGWSAFNVARVEAGRVMFNIDFGPTNLPHETGIVDELVSFTKGCYRGQEIVARMQSLGHPARCLVGFVVQDSEKLPVAGSPLLDPDDPAGDPVGAITSSANSPRRSGRPVGIGMVKWDMRQPDTTLRAPAEGEPVQVRLCELDQITTFD
jgi:folate-binding protein YgfZ